MPEVPEALTLSVRNVYDHGVLVRTDRWSTPDSAHVDTISTRWRYDVAGRKVAEIAPTSPDSAERRDSTVYDPAGNVIRTVDRLNQQVAMQYDALGRMIQRTLPATTGAAGDVETFTYDAMGRLRSALNAAARVRRGYLRGGGLAADTLEIATEAGGWGRHVYVTRYGYDLEGRRITMTVPDSVAPSATQNQVSYAYDPVTGALRTVTDPLGNAYSFAHRLDGALDTLRLPGPTTETYRYDNDGRMIHRLRTLAGPGFTSTLYDDSLAYTARGKMAFASVLDGNSRMEYDGLGHLAHSYSHDASVHTGQDSEEEYRSDALGNTLWHRHAGFTSETAPPSGTIYPVSQFYQRWTGRHYASMKAANTSFTGYLKPREDANRTFDAAGNLTVNAESNSIHVMYGAVPEATIGRPNRTLYADPDDQFRSLGGNVINDGYLDATTQYVYRGDGRMVSVTRYASCIYLIGSASCTYQIPDYNSQTRIETYRYDALGRRVWVKTVTPVSTASSPTSVDPGKCAFRCDNTTRRTIWDGDQVLAEIRYPNGQGEQDSGLDSANVAARTVWEASPLTAQGHVYGGTNTSDWAQHGRVLYVHAGGIDQPLGLIRMDYSYNFPAATLLVPHANWRGVYENATVLRTPARCTDVYLPESELVYMDSTGHRMVAWVASGPDGEEMDSIQTRCIEVDFPGKVMGMRYLLKQNTVAGPISWMGSLVQDNQDASGLMYRRNRFSDPKAGRFTQEDPIGLAGGVNAYGFAEGDPVKYNDPFGLCKYLRGIKAPCELILVIFGEASNENIWGMYAVGNVVRNRLHGPHEFRGVSSYEAAITHSQFNAVGGRQWNRGLAFMQSGASLGGDTDAFKRAVSAAETVFLNGPDFAEGATWFATPGAHGPAVKTCIARGECELVDVERDENRHEFVRYKDNAPEPREDKKK